MALILPMLCAKFDNDDCLQFSHLRLSCRYESFLQLIITKFVMFCQNEQKYMYDPWLLGNVISIKPINVSHQTSLKASTLLTIIYEIGIHSPILNIEKILKNKNKFQLQIRKKCGMEIWFKMWRCSRHFVCWMPRIQQYIDWWLQDSDTSIANMLEMSQFCTKTFKSE